MDSPTAWILLILLLLLIGIVVFWLLRRPGDDGDAALHARDRDEIGSHDARDTTTTGAGTTTDPALSEDLHRDGAGRDAHLDRDADHQVTGQTGPAPMGEPVGGTETHQGADAHRATGAYQEPDTHQEPTHEDSAPLTSAESRYDAQPQEPVGDGTQEPTFDGTPDATVDGEDDPGRWREAAAIGATGAAGGATAAAAHRDGQDDTLRDAQGVDPVAQDGSAYEDESTYQEGAATYQEGAATYGDEASTDAPTDQAGATYTGAATDRDGAYTDAPAHQDDAYTDAPTHQDDADGRSMTQDQGVQPLSDEQIDAGASDEPLTADEVLASQGGGSTQEYPVGDDATTYRADQGDAVAMGEGERGRDDLGTYDDGDAGVGRSDEFAATEDHGDAGDDERRSDDGWGTASAAGAAGAGAAGAGAIDTADDERQPDLWSETGTPDTADPATPVTDDRGTYAGDDGGTYAGDDLQGQSRDQDDAWASTGAAGAGAAGVAGAAGAAGAGQQERQDDTWGSTETADTATPVTDSGSSATGDEAPVFAESIYGAGSAEPLEDGSGPSGWTVKGNAGSMLFHTPDSPSYDGVRAEVWFENEEAARAAGFAHWDRRQR